MSTPAVELEPTQVHCDTCGARPGMVCATPTGKPTKFHQDRRANAHVISRHLNWTRNHPEGNPK